MEKCVFNKGKKCSALTPKKCKNCSFRKTEAELNAGREKARERLESLPKEQQDAIMRKYYGLRRVEDAEVEEYETD